MDWKTRYTHLTEPAADPVGLGPGISHGRDSCFQAYKQLGGSGLPGCALDTWPEWAWNEGASPYQVALGACGIGQA